MLALEVWLHGKRVGLLERFPDEHYRFSFAQEWLRDPERPTLGQIFEDRRPDSIETSGLTGWFGHLLPQPGGPLHRLLREEATQRGFVDEDGDPTDFMLLGMVGDDLPGAVELRPGERRWPSPVGRDRLPGTSIRREGGLYPSLAGMQLKLSVGRDEDGVFTVPVSGRGGRWIAKFDRDGCSFPRVEYATTCWASASGVNTSDVQLSGVRELRGLPAEFSRDGQVFLVRRFDRADDRRVHFEDFAQILDRPMPNGFFRGSVEEIAAVLAALEARDGQELIQRVVFCALSREWDGHLKNWAMLYPDGRQARLSPAYDLLAGVYAHPSTSEDRMVLSVGGSRRFEDLRPASFHGLGRLLGLGERLTEQIAVLAADRVREAWLESAAALPWTDREREELERHMGRVPLGLR